MCLLHRLKGILEMKLGLRPLRFFNSLECSILQNECFNIEGHFFIECLQIECDCFGYHAADDPGIPQTGDNSGVVPSSSGAAGHDLDPNHVQTSKKQHLVKNDAVLELIAGGNGVSARYLKPPPHLAGVALEKTHLEPCAI